MSDFPPEGAACANHAEAPATWTCNRCGSFMCAGCERRTRPEARPMCPSCWALRSRSVPENQGRSRVGLQTIGLVLGVVSLIPMCVAVQIASLVVNIVAMVKAKDLPEGHPRWKAITGLALTLLGVGITVLVVLRAD